jgi:hypothetical protein
MDTICGKKDMKVTNDIEFGIGVEEAVSGLKH